MSCTVLIPRVAETGHRLSSDDFRAAFTTAEAWGTFAQKRTRTTHTAQITPRWGTLRVHTVTLTPRAGFEPETVTATLDGQPLPAALLVGEGCVTITIQSGAGVQAGETLAVGLT